MKGNDIQPINFPLPNMLFYYSSIHSHMLKPRAKERTKIIEWLKCARQGKALIHYLSVLS